MPIEKVTGEITPGQQYLLDEKTVVTVIKPLNRAKTSFSVEVPGRGVDSVGKEQLREVLSSPKLEQVGEGFRNNVQKGRVE